VGLEPPDLVEEGEDKGEDCDVAVHDQDRGWIRRQELLLGWAIGTAGLGDPARTVGARAA